MTRPFKGYIASRPIEGRSYPQRIQNLLVRDYAQRMQLPFELSATEFAMPHSYMVLTSVLDSLATLGGVIFFSAFMLPQSRVRRKNVYEQFLRSGAELHAALENIALRTADDIERFEDVILVNRALAHTPFSGRFLKSGSAPVPEIRAFLT